MQPSRAAQPEIIGGWLYGATSRRPSSGGAHHQDGEVVAGGLFAEVAHALLEQPGEDVRRRAGGGRADRQQAVVAEHPVAVAPLGDPVGVEDQRITRGQDQLVSRHLDVLEDAEQAAAGAHEGRASLCGHEHRRRVAGRRQTHRQPRRRGPHGGHRRGAEAAAVAEVEDRGVEPAQDGRWRDALPSEQAQDVAGQPGDGCGLRALAARRRSRPPTVRRASRRRRRSRRRPLSRGVAGAELDVRRRRRAERQHSPRLWASAGNLVGVLVELSARVQHSHHQLQGVSFFFEYSCRLEYPVHHLPH